MKLDTQFTRKLEGVRYVFLDRDGVINRKAAEGDYVSDWADFQLLPGVEEAIARLNRHGCRVIVVSNQRGIALGLYTASAVETLHDRLQQHLATHGAHVDAFYYCPHDRGKCQCRKPGIALFKQAQECFPEVDPATCVVIGDSLSDIEAARAFGCQAIFIRGDEATRKGGADRAEALADAVVESLVEAVAVLSLSARPGEAR